jgi:DNA-binding Lrp family transcriptional regulator
MSRLEDYKWMLHYIKMLDPVNARILAGLGKFGPRNTSFLARSLGLPTTTVAFRIKKLLRKGYLQVRTNLDYSKIGLIKAVLIAASNGGFVEKLRETVKNIDYWTYLTKCYGKFNGIYALFAFPAEHRDKLEAYLEEAVHHGAISNYVFFWLTNLCEVPPNFDWYDFKSKAWKFEWHRWVDEVVSASETLPAGLMEPGKYRIAVDKTDLFLLKELEKDAFVEFTRIADALKMTPQGVSYRYYKHLVKQGLIRDYEIAIFPYPLLVSDLCSFIIHFENGEALAKFSNTLSDKPFILSYGKIIGRDSLLLHSYTPKTEFPNFIGALNSLVRKNLLKDFFYVSLNITAFERKTICYESFHSESWTFNYEEKVKQLAKIMRKT